MYNLQDILFNPLKLLGGFDFSSLVIIYFYRFNAEFAILVYGGIDILSLSYFCFLSDVKY